ncbi:MAG: hypothetical protein ACXAD7_18975, partial [Candidatus Kariarchaeaceae archaeon]
MFIQFVKFASNLTEDELLKKVEERKPQFEHLAGLRQKYYVREPATGEYGGIYVWESKEAMLEFQQSELAKSIIAAYEVNGQP